MRGFASEIVRAHAAAGTSAQTVRRSERARTTPLARVSWPECKRTFLRGLLIGLLAPAYNSCICSVPFEYALFEKVEFARVFLRTQEHLIKLRK